jgi:multidrug efflux pump subunit AcrA (membrane-fusion protein)
LIKYHVGKIATIIKKAVATGSVVPRREIEIKPRVSGIVEEVESLAWDVD